MTLPAAPYRHRFPVSIISQAVWICHRFPTGTVKLTHQGHNRPVLGEFRRKEAVELPQSRYHRLLQRRLYVRKLSLYSVQHQQQRGYGLFPSEIAFSGLL